MKENQGQPLSVTRPLAPWASASECESESESEWESKSQSKAPIPERVIDEANIDMEKASIMSQAKST
ncbi:GL22001 [Drosophila persimilis]|uniref:GL22001 n=1 Tax=Drosophila persimilis TaxID=7234 RepID=B4GED9_DROPE|nr:GL22001 [Drosophila persimilis]